MMRRSSVPRILGVVARTLGVVSVFAALIGTVIALSSGNWPLAGVGAALCLAGIVALVYVG